MAELKLDNLVRVLSERKTPRSSADLGADLLNYAKNKTMEDMLNRLGQPHVTPEELNAGLERLANGLVSLAKKIDGTKTDVAPVLQAIKALEAGVNRLASAVSGIKLPDVNIPEFPAPQTVDLSPVLSALDGIYRVLAEMQADEAEDEAEPEEPEKPKEWVFEVKRNQAGFIRTIEAREV